MKSANRSLWHGSLALFCVLVLFSANQQVARAQEYDDTRFDFNRELEQTLQLIVMLNVEFAGAPEFGSGIIVGRGKDRLFIATAYHVLHRGAGHPVIGVKFKDFPDKTLLATLLKHDEDTDLAVLSVENLPNENVNQCALNFARLGNTQLLRRGSAVLAVGNPNGVPWASSVEPDLIARTSGKEIVFQSTFIRRGHSGGALLNENGHIVGMTTADESPFGRATKIDVALGMVKQWGYPMNLDRALAAGMTPLHGAARAGDLPAIRTLLADCGPNAKDYRGGTPLHHAALHEKPDAASLLIKAGADVNALDNYGDPPLQWAIGQGRTEIVRILVAAGAKLDIRAYSALLQGSNLDQETILFLVQSGANVNPATEYKTPLHAAVENKQVETVRALLKAGARIDVEDNDKRTPLYSAVKTQQVKIVAMLLNAGAKADPFDEDVVPLHEAVSNNNVEIVKLLIAKGINLNVADAGGSHGTALHMAVGDETLSLEITKILIKAGADINARAMGKETPLYVATHNGREDAVRELLQAGADVNARDVYNNTPLLEAIKRNLPNAVKILLQAGADVNVKNDEGYTALYLADYSTPAIAELLRQHRAKQK